MTPEIDQNGATTEPLAMFATLGGSLALLLGLVVLLVPLLTPELSRARDAVWGAVLLLLGLVLVTSSDRLGGSPMVAVLCGSLLIGRLGSEVGQQRWRALTPEEQQRLGSGAHWRTALGQVLASLGALQGMASESLSGLRTRLPQAPASAPTAFKGKAKAKAGGQTKRWVRPEATDAAGDEPASPSGIQTSPETIARPGDEGDLDPRTPETPVIEVSSFAEIEALVDAAWGEAPPPAPADDEPARSEASEANQEAQTSLTSPPATQKPAEAAAMEPRNEAG